MCSSCTAERLSDENIELKSLMFSIEEELDDENHSPFEMVQEIRRLIKTAKEEGLELW